ncbi:MAG: calcium-binding protein, partial [Rubrivivax sp.]|nr:calcium-binding protein [Rubrivivax sp.]
NDNEESPAFGVNADLAFGVVSGGYGNDTLVGIDNLFGSSFADNINGNGAANLLFGGAGNDTLMGGGGNDTLNGESGIDWLTGGAGTDLYMGGADSDVVFFEDAPAGATVNLLTGVISNDGYGNAESIFDVENLHGTHFSDHLTLGNGNSYVFGRAGNDTIVGGNGSNNIFGGSGNDSINGGSGTDTANYSSADFDAGGPATQGVTANLSTGLASDNWGHTDTLVSIENLTGSPLADSLTGSAGNNFIDGGAGNDSLYGGDGEDTLRGGAGDDLIDGGTNVLSTTFDRVDYNDSSASVNVNLTTGIATGAGIGTDTLVGIEGITGSAFDDTLVGASTPDLLTGGLGNDILDGAGGFDIVSYGAITGNIVVNLALGTATGAGGNDTLISIEGVIAGSGNDHLIGTSAGDFLRGNAGNDTIDGGAGQDRAAYDFGPAGSSSVNASLITNTVTGTGFGTDTLINIENLRGSNFSDVLEGDGGANDFQGRGGDDTLIGNGANASAGGDAGGEVDVDRRR